MMAQTPPKEYFAEVAVAQGVVPLEALVPELPGVGEVGLFSNAQCLKQGLIYRWTEHSILPISTEGAF